MLNKMFKYSDYNILIVLYKGNELNNIYQVQCRIKKVLLLNIEARSCLKNHHVP